MFHQDANDGSPVTRPQLHLISDSTGETVNAVLRASLAKFDDVEPDLHMTVFVRSAADLDVALERVSNNPGLVVYTLADAKLHDHLVRFCANGNFPCVPVLDPVVSALSDFLGKEAQRRPGMQHRVNSEYFDRVAALDFAISYDDGASGDRLMQADVILTGVSRTSKTPTCIYLAYRAIKAANVPLIPKNRPPQAFFDALERGIPIIGLTASPGRLSQVRTNRLQTLGASKSVDYAEIDAIRGEVADALLFFERHAIPVIDVTRRSIEETAAEVLAILRARGLSKA